MKSERAGKNLITDVCHTMKSDRDEKNQFQLYTMAIMKIVEAGNG